jgi:hypothetical protein
MIVCSNQECANHEPHDGARFSAVACAVVDCVGQVECYEDPGDGYVCRLCGSAAGQEEYFEEDGPDPDGQLAMMRYYEDLHERRDAERQMEASMYEPDDDNDSGDRDDIDIDNGIPVLCCSNEACDCHDPYRTVFPPFTAVVEVSGLGIPYPDAVRPEKTKCPKCGSAGVTRYREIRYADSNALDDSGDQSAYDFFVRATMRAHVRVYARSLEEAQELFVTRDLQWDDVEWGRPIEGADAHWYSVSGDDSLSEEDVPF